MARPGRTQMYPAVALRFPFASLRGANGTLRSPAIDGKGRGKQRVTRIVGIPVRQTFTEAGVSPSTASAGLVPTMRTRVPTSTIG
jgi:hypothetical protein